MNARRQLAPELASELAPGLGPCREGRSSRLGLVSLLVVASSVTACGQPAHRDVDPAPVKTAPVTEGPTTGPGRSEMKPGDPSSKLTPEQLLEALAGGDDAESIDRREQALDQILDSTEELGRDAGANSPSSPVREKTSRANPEPIDPPDGSVASRDLQLPADVYDPLTDSVTMEKALPSDDPALGLRRTDDDHWQGSLFGLPASVSVAQYDHRKSGRIRLQVSDLGRECAELTRRALQWHRAAAIPDSPDGLQFARAKVLDGNAAFVRYDGLESTASLEVVVKGRFHVYLVGRMLHLATLESVFRAIDFESVTP